MNLVYRYFKPLLKRAGLPNIHFHNPRHTCSSLLGSKEVNPKVIQQRLGRSNISMAMDTYSHPMPSLQDEAAAMDGLLS